MKRIFFFLLVLSFNSQLLAKAPNAANKSKAPAAPAVVSDLGATAEGSASVEKTKDAEEPEAPVVIRTVIEGKAADLIFDHLSVEAKGDKPRVKDAAGISCFAEKGKKTYCQFDVTSKGFDK